MGGHDPGPIALAGPGEPHDGEEAKTKPDARRAVGRVRPNSSASGDKPFLPARPPIELGSPSSPAATRPRCRAPGDRAGRVSEAVNSIDRSLMSGASELPDCGRAAENCAHVPIVADPSSSPRQLARIAQLIRGATHGKTSSHHHRSGQGRRRQDHGLPHAARLLQRPSGADARLRHRSAARHAQALLSGHHRGGGHDADPGSDEDVRHAQLRGRGGHADRRARRPDVADAQGAARHRLHRGRQEGADHLRGVPHSRADHRLARRDRRDRRPIWTTPSTSW